MRGPARVKFPYHRALKAYAYAGKEIDFALDQLRNMHLATPDSSNPMHEIIFGAAEAQFLEHQRNARMCNPDMEFSKSQAETFGISPFYSWIMEEEEGPASNEAKFMDFIIGNIRDANLRKFVCVGMYAGATPEQIYSEMKKSVAGVIWPTDAIVTFGRFFWDMEGMTNEDWLAYLSVEREALPSASGGVRPNPHFQYVKQMYLSDSKKDLLFVMRMPASFAPPMEKSELKEEFYTMTRQCLRNNDRMGAKTYGHLALAFEEYEKEGSSDVDRQLQADMAQLKVLASPIQYKEAGVDPVSLGHIRPLPPGGVNGPISDPRLKKQPPKPPDAE